jgi:hypothetical protein
MLIKNILSNSYKHDLQELLGNFYFPWNWNETTQSNDVSNKEDIFFHFTHNLFDLSQGGALSEHFVKILPIIYFFEKETGFQVKNIIRVKANLLTQFDKTDEEIKSAMHRDIGCNNINDTSQNEQFKNYVSFIYYVIDSDGDTVIYDDEKNEIERASPIAGNLVWFKSTLPHHATPPKINKRRVIINFIAELKDI